ncbi:hypothetical protein B296_00049285 [Ensete ventricosum]|uniref:Uncharacterized protein n=1 Tax=Ensete ventricosum TaxID=4639 RepID=A0A426YB01_ENSVE|nr:hypothetical protein B296_00049285 [Ensete ventricosum]
MENLTASEIAGFGVGALLLCATIAAPRVDAFISASQRRSVPISSGQRTSYLSSIINYRSLDMCKRCGNLRMIACSQCKGIGSVRKGGTFGFRVLEAIYESLEDRSTPKQLVPCIKCQSKGRLPCPNCSKLP